MRQTGGENKGNQWPHPTNEEFNDMLKRTTKIYAIGNPDELQLLVRARDYLISRIQNLYGHKILRPQEEMFKEMHLCIDHGIGKSEDEAQLLLSNCDLVLAVGSWAQEPKCLRQFKNARAWNKPVVNMVYNPEVPITQTVRFLAPVRPIQSASWNKSIQEDMLFLQNEEGMYEIIDGNHRHELATRLGTVKNLSGWLLKIL